MCAEIAVSESTIQSVQSQGITWLNVERPTKREFARLAESYQILTRDSESLLDRGRPSAFFRRGGYDLVILQIPTVATSRRRTNPTISPVSVFVGGDYVLTVHNGDIRPLLRLFRELETNDREREETFGQGVPALVFAIVRRLIDATTASRGYLERAIATQEELINQEGGSNELAGSAVRLRKEVQGLRRIASPIVPVVRELRQNSRDQELSQDWDALVVRLDTLVTTLDDDLATLDGVLLAASAAAQIRTSRHLRSLFALAALVMPILVVTTTLSMTANNPLTNQTSGFTIGLALAGIVFLVALFVARRNRLV